MSLIVRPLGERFGAEISGVIFHSAPTSEQARQIETAMDHYAVVVLRDQVIDDQQQIAFSRVFGPLELPPSLGIRNSDTLDRIRPELFDVSNLDKRGEIEKADSLKRQFGKANELFHTDSSYNNLPTKWSILSARILPEGGGHTEFIDMRAVYQELSEDTRTSLVGLSAEHSLWHSREQAGFAMTDEMKNAVPPALHPLVQTAPDGRRTLFLSSHASHIGGWPKDKGRALLDRLYRFANQDRFRYRHHWCPGDLLIWDNRCTMHRAISFDNLNQKRDMRRTTINESGPECSAAI